MARSALIHYIAPSAISITPNANGTQRDLAVYVARGAKIKVYSPHAGIDTVNAVYQEWTLSGRNRRLNDPGGTMPYTIFARLRKNDNKTGYLVFAPKTLLGSDKETSQPVWVDKYSSVTPSGTSVLYTESGVEVKNESDVYWYIRLGEVSLPDASGKRTVTLDTGILGTDQFNQEWVLNPESLPLRAELECLVNGKAAGQTPYVDWSQSAVLSATLIEGWNTNVSDRVHHWAITRNTGHEEEDSLWNYPYAEEDSSSSDEEDESSEEEKWPTPDTPHLMTGSNITLAHLRAGADDFEAAPATVFIVTAWGVKTETNGVPEMDDIWPSSSNSSEDEEAVYVPLAQTAITIYANDTRLHVQIDCSIDGQTIGQTPYIPWDKELLMSARLIEGFDGDAQDLVDHWTITRYTGNEESDSAWNYPQDDSPDSSEDSESSSPEVMNGSSSGEEALPDPPAARLMEDGSITLAHQRTDTDDFAAAVAAVFTITAWGMVETETQGQTNSQDNSSSDDEEDEPTYAPMATGIITVFPETIDRYELALSSTVMGYNPQTKVYTPAGGIDVRIRITEQSGNRFNISQEMLEYAGFTAGYAPVGTDVEEGLEGIVRPTDDSSGEGADNGGSNSSEEELSPWTQLAFAADADGVAVATIPAAAFAILQPMNVRLVNGASVLLDLRTVAFVRDGDDSKEREYIFMRSATAIDFDASASASLVPSLITMGEVRPAGAAAAVTAVSDQDEWVPQGWWDDAQGVSQEFPYEYESYRDFIHRADISQSDDSSLSSSEDDSAEGQWGEFCTPFLRNHYGRDGENVLILDIDNEYDSVQTDSTGKILSARTISTTVRLYDGQTEADISAVPVSVSGGPASSIAIFSQNPEPYSGKGRVLSWDFVAGRMMDDYDVEISYTRNSVTYKATFTIVASKGQAVYQIKSSMSAVPFAYVNDSYYPASRNVGLEVVKIDFDSTTNMNVFSNTGTVDDGAVFVRYSTSSMPAGKTDGTAWPQGTGTTVPVPNSGVANLYIAIFNANGTLLDRETIPVMKDGAAGENSVRIGLDNEHEDFLYDDAGVRKSGIVTSQARLYDGASEKTTGVTWAVSDDEDEWVIQSDTYTDTNAKAKISSSGLLTVEEIYVPSAKVRVRATYKDNFYYADFTANRICQDKYELVLEPNAITYNPATYTTQAVTISATRLDLQGNKTALSFGSYSDKTMISTTSGKGYLRLFAPVRTSVAPGVYDYIPTQITSANFSVTSRHASEQDNILFQLRKYDDDECEISDSNGQNGTLVDYETVPINKSENGEMGKMFYPMGEWVEQTYERIDDRIPLVHYGTAWNEDLQVYGSYYYLSVDLATADDVPGVSNKWELCDDFGVVITQGLFAEFAKLGSAIMSGDYMFSMNGRIGSTEYNEGQSLPSAVVTRPAYTWFKGDPSQQTGTFFEPNWWVDLKTGKMSAARGNFIVNPNGDVYVKGDIHATSGEFTGTVHANDGEFTGIVKARMMYSDIAWINRTSYTINPNINPANLYISFDFNRDVTLPDARDYQGLILRFLSTVVPDEGTENYGIKLITYNSDQKIKAKSGWKSLTNPITQAHIINEKIVSLIAANENWYLLEGEIGTSAEQITI